MQVRINKWSAPIRSQSKLTRLFRTELEIIQSEQQKEMTTYDLHSCAVPCEQLANCEFALNGVRNLRFSTFNQNSSNKETTTYDSSISTRVCRPCELLANCEFPLHGVRNSRFSTFNQNSSNKETTTYDSSISTRVCRPCELLANCEFPLHGVRNSRFSTFNQNSSNKETTTLRLVNLHSYPPSVRTANLLFVEGTHLGHQNRQRN